MSKQDWLEEMGTNIDYISIQAHNLGTRDTKSTSYDSFLKGGLLACSL